MNSLHGIGKFVRRLSRYDARYFRHKIYDSDDMHSAEYGLHVRKIVAERGTERFSMRRHTHDKFGRYSMLVFRKDPT